MGLPNCPGRGPEQATFSGVKRSPDRDRRAIGYAADTSNEFYKLSLDPNMLYSCAYLHSPGEELDTARERKIDLICRKIRLRPGERMLDVGRGWGGLVVHAAPVTEPVRSVPTTLRYSRPRRRHRCLPRSPGCGRSAGPVR